MFLVVLATLSLFPTVTIAGGGGELQLMQMGSSSCAIITIGTENCIVQPTFVKPFPFAPNVTIATNTIFAGGSNGGTQDVLQGESYFLFSNTTMSFNIPKNCSVVSPCDVLSSQHIISEGGQVDIGFGLACIATNATSTVGLSFELFSSTTITGTYVDTGQGISFNTASCVSPVSYFESTPNPDLNSGCVGSFPSGPCFYKIRVVQSPAASVIRLTTNSVYMKFFQTVLLVCTCIVTAAFTTGFVWSGNIQIRSGINSIPISINVTWVAVECITSAGYTVGNC
jgi:hypothetical protein